MTCTDDRIEPFTPHTEEAELEDLRARLAVARLPERETVRGTGPERWAQGVPLDVLAEVLEHWRTGHDWREAEARLAAVDQYLVPLDGLRIHALHRPSPRPDATPLLLTHGWPGSIIEFVHLVDELAEPADPGEPAFHVVVPSLPGFGYSDKPFGTGWGTERIAAAWARLMEALGHRRFLAHGGDWGGVISTILAARFPDQMIGLHTTVAQPPPWLSLEGLDAEGREWVRRSQDFWSHHAAYAKIQAAQPQTVGYSLVDSPVGLLAWILDKFAAWSDTRDSPFETIDRDRLLDNVTLYWLTRSGASAARIYAESHDSLDPDLRVDVPTAITTYPRDIERWPRPWAQERYRRIVRWEEPDAGGHFPSLERPEFFLRDLRASLAAVLAADQSRST
ncbi:epoxide hydrolase family protein [Brachybacterium paraconglomeratum]|uniref:epoxide hydrolase family protein n=1 Tax=Brachybacterium paraconglomeratum TaxID=173362 RepID=UPI0022B0604C|nr:epoxide hydrolase [Brachybacterium paraconglomeratum]MCZ4327311.1 epoxide hydrolase [Brachybacterium paraconglomeratum]